MRGNRGTRGAGRYQASWAVVTEGRQGRGEGSSWWSEEGERGWNWSYKWGGWRRGVIKVQGRGVGTLPNSLLVVPR